MGEVRYSINGKYFKDFGIYVSDSDGLFDALKRKKVNSYDWAEYHGSAPDLSNPKFEAREITLVGFVVGENWDVMKSNFDAIISEFQKAGTQRLLIEPFGLKPLPYEVYIDDSISLKKTFKNGKMVGTFTLKMIEPNPIKKVLYFIGETLNLSYTSPNETEISYGNGTKDVVKTNASLSGKVLANRAVSAYRFAGRNLLKNAIKPKTLSFWGSYTNTTVQILGDELRVTATGVNPRFLQKSYIPLKDKTQNYVVRISYRSSAYLQDITGKYSPGLSSGESYNEITMQLVSNESVDAFQKISTYKFTAKAKDTDLSFFILMWLPPTQVVVVYDIKLEEGTVATPFSPAPEYEKFIVIAGNIEEISNLTTNAEVLWERL